MAANPNQQGGGGMFARYGGEQVQSVPQGYLEAAQAQASLYANIGTQIANSIYKKQEMEMKAKELEVASEANKVGAGKNAAAERKNDLTEAAKEDDTLIKWIGARTNAAKEAFGAIDKAMESIDARISGLQLKLDKDADPDEKGVKLTNVERNSLLGQIKALQEKRAGHQAEADELMKGMKNLPTSLAEYKLQEAERVRKEIEKRMNATNPPQGENPIQGFLNNYVRPATRVAAPFMGGLPATISAPISLFNAYQPKTK